MAEGTEAITDSTENTHDLFAVRKGKLDEMRAKGFDPFRADWEQSHTSAQAIALYCEDEEKSPTVFVAGRIVAFRLMGKAAFVKLLDRAGKIQAYFKEDLLGEAYEEFKKLDIGDIIGCSGKLFKTKTGEVTIKAEKFCLVSKALRPLPEKWHGLTDNEQIYRQRYLDLIVNDDSRERFFKRSRILQEIRKFLWGRDFTEVETPVFQTTTGGAAARPFITHMNALNCEFRLRISLELYLKRMLVGGFDRVFEMGRIFRNEGLSRQHNPEFTMIELYQAYSDFRGMMELIYELVQHLCKTVLGKTQVKRPDGTVIELGGKWREVTYKDLVTEATKNKEWFSLNKHQKLEACKKLGVEIVGGPQDFEITDSVFKKLVEPYLVQPTFVTHIPKELCPLAKINLKDKGTLDVFELCINGQEVAPAYSEQNDPFIQRQMIEAQVGEEKQEMDQDFLTALEHGMPPAGGMGIGIDRLCILLTEASNIRDTILFPSLKPTTV